MLSSFILGAVIGGIGVKYGSKLVKRLGNEENSSVVRQIVDVVKTVAEDTVEGTKEILSENLDILNYSINEIVNEHNNKKYDDLDDELFDREGYGSFEDEECDPFDEDDECDLFEDGEEDEMPKCFGLGFPCDICENIECVNRVDDFICDDCVCLDCDAYSPECCEECKYKDKRICENFLCDLENKEDSWKEKVCENINNLSNYIQDAKKSVENKIDDTKISEKSKEEFENLKKAVNDFLEKVEKSGVKEEFNKKYDLLLSYIAKRLVQNEVKDVEEENEAVKNVKKVENKKVIEEEDPFEEVLKLFKNELKNKE